MIQAQIKQTLRLNRSMSAAFLLFHALAAVAVKGVLPGILLTLSVVLALAYFVGNEVVLRTMKRIAANRMEPMVLEKMALLLPVVSAVFVLASYLLTGQLGIAVFAVIVMLQAYMCGYRWLARAVLVTFGVVYALSALLHYPVGVMGGVDAFALNQPFGIIVALLPMILTLNQYGQMAHGLMRSTSDRVEILQSLAAIDGLTGLINRRQFNHQLHAEISRARRSKKPLSLALFDIDDFKKINDFYGHPVGDRILRELGSLITNNVRESDVPARYGGEEFSLILPETSQIEAYEILERLRQLIEHTVFCLPDNPMTITVSVGVAQMDLDQATSFELIEQADTALYEAKRQGKNRVVYGVVTAPKLTGPYNMDVRPLL